MKAIVERALKLWGLEGAGCGLVAARENHVFRVDHNGERYALRLHRKGYRSDAELRSELMWMNALSRGSIGVPAPVASVSGQHLQTVENTQVDMLCWLSGEPIGSSNGGLQVEDRVGLLRDIGRQMARMHKISDDWDRPEKFVRPVLGPSRPGG